jgi:hypothetical protein
MEFISSLTKYVKDLEEKNVFLERDCAQLIRENERLKDNEKEMFKVSSIISTSNENTKLKNYINILEEQLKKHKQTVVYDVVKEEEITTLNQPVIDEPIDEPVVDEPIDEPVVDEPIDEPVIDEPIDEPVVDEPIDEPVVDETHNDSINSLCDVIEEQVQKVSTSICEVGLTNEEIDEVDTEVLRHFKYKGVSYLMDENNILYENIDDDKGDVVGKRRFNIKTNKWKTIIN